MILKKFDKDSLIKFMGYLLPEFESKCKGDLEVFLTICDNDKHKTLIVNATKLRAAELMVVTLSGLMESKNVRTSKDLKRGVEVLLNLMA